MPRPEPEQESDWIDAVYSEDGVLVYTLGAMGGFNRGPQRQVNGHMSSVRMGAWPSAWLCFPVGAGLGWWLPEAAIISASAAWSLVNTIGTGENSPFEDRVIALDFVRTGNGYNRRLSISWREIYIWNVEDGSECASPGHSDTFCSLAFSPDGSQLAWRDRSVRSNLRDKPGKELALEGHTGHVLGVSWQRNGRVLASVGADKAVKVWNLINGGQKKSFSGFNKEVTSVHFLGINAGRRRPVIMW